MRQPIKDIWGKMATTQNTDKLIVIKVMTARFSAPYRKNKIESGEKTLKQEEIIIRHIKATTLKDN